ncbi:MAG: hypothetical protein J5449_01150, partial [Oscillospiraceae bacterium]|nr:hypothetical protein [Oscillospiraceae bacterium]
MKVAGKTKGKLTAYLLMLAILLSLPITAHLFARAESSGTGAESDPFIVDTWADLQTALAAGGYVRLGGNVTAPQGAESLTVSDGVTAVLDLKGFTLNVQGAKKTVDSNDQNIGIYVAPGGDLTVRDTGGTGIITGSYDYGVFLDNATDDSAAAHFTLESGTISGNETGVLVDPSTIMAKPTVFDMTGGAVKDNKSCGVFTKPASYAQFNMSGGSITGNGSNPGFSYSGGVCIEGGTFNMTDGTISGNSGLYGGVGLTADINSSMNMSGGIITGNSASEKGGGVYVGAQDSQYNARVAKLRLSGTAKITGNVFGGTITDGVPVGGTSCNVYLTTGTGQQGTVYSVVSLLGALEDGANIGVTATYAATDAVIAQGDDGMDGYTAYTLTGSDAAKLHYDVEGYDVLFSDGKAKLRSVTSVGSWADLQTALNAGGYVR